MAVSNWLRDLCRAAQEVELLHRSMSFAALGLVTLVPLLIVVAAADPFQHHGLAGWVVDGMDLPHKDAAAVQRLFATQHQVLSTTSALSLAAVAVFGLTFVSAVQAGYERVWRLPAGPWRHTWRRAVWLAVLTVYLYVLAKSHDLLDGGTAQTTTRIVLILATGLVFFWWGQSFLLGHRVPWSALLPGAVATVAGLAGLRWFSGLVFSRMIVNNAVSYGIVGTVLVVESWLIGLGFVLFGGALLGRTLSHHRPDLE